MGMILVEDMEMRAVQAMEMIIVDKEVIEEGLEMIGVEIKEEIGNINQNIKIIMK